MSKSSSSLKSESVTLEYLKDMPKYFFHRTPIMPSSNLMIAGATLTINYGIYTLEQEMEALRTVPNCRLTLHWALNHVVYEHFESSSHEKAPYIIIEPLESLAAEIYGGEVDDVITFGSHYLSKNAIVIIPENEHQKFLAINQGFLGRIITYNAQKESALSKANEFIKQKNIPNIITVSDGVNLEAIRKGCTLKLGRKALEKYNANNSTDDFNDKELEAYNILTATAQKYKSEFLPDNALDYAYCNRSSFKQQDLISHLAADTQLYHGPHCISSLGRLDKALCKVFKIFNLVICNKVLFDRRLNSEIIDTIYKINVTNIEKQLKKIDRLFEETLQDLARNKNLSHQLEWFKTWQKNCKVWLKFVEDDLKAFNQSHESAFSQGSIMDRIAKLNKSHSLSSYQPNYQLFTIPKFDENKALLIKSLGGEIIKDNNNAIVRINSDVLKKDERKILGIDRKLISFNKDSTEKVSYLSKFDDITIEKAKDSEKFLVTFPINRLELISRVANDWPAMQHERNEAATTIQNSWRKFVEKRKNEQSELAL